VTDARTFAAEAHAQAGDTYGEGQPYTVHLAEVVAIVEGLNDPSLAGSFLCDVAWLHDILEDTPVTVTELENRFGHTVALAVRLVTDPEGYPNRRTRKAALHETLAALDPRLEEARAALLVKAADRLANVRACCNSGDSRLKMYQREHAAFRAAAYRPGLCDVLWAELDSLI
jgi:(p)ppGpp synthase/HD superfamily hydrolase